MSQARPERSSGHVTVLGRRLYFERLHVASDSARPLLVFLHEGLGSVAQWKDFPDRLCAATGLAGLVYDRYGHGRSDGLAAGRAVDYLEAEARDFLPGLLGALAVDQPLVLIGHSDGGTIALLHAGLNPAVSGLVTEAAHVFVEDITLAGIRDARRAFDGDPALRQALQRYHGEHTDSLFRGWSETWLDPAFRNMNIEHELPAVSCPALIMQGEADEYGTARQVDAIVAGLGGPATPMMMAGVGHTPHREAGELTLEAMRRFVVALG